MNVQSEVIIFKASEQMSPPVILQADGNEIVRSTVLQGATIEIPPIAQARVGDTLQVFVDCYGTFFTYLELTAAHLGKPLRFSVVGIVFSQGDTVVAHYSLVQGDKPTPSASAIYKLIDPV